MEIRAMRIIMMLALLGAYLVSCSSQQNQQTTLFTTLTPEQTNIYFENRIQETEDLNYFTHPHILYTGAGVAIGDINNDGLEDIFFAGNMGRSILYLNQGDLVFEDISIAAGIDTEGTWITGVTMTDINNDRYLDLYLSVNGHGDDKHNLLFINNGDLTFSEMASSYGIDDNGSTIQSVFFDYDNDGLNDLLIINYPKIAFITTDAEFNHRASNFAYEESDKLFRNLGNGKFQDVTTASGIANFGLSLSASVADYNQDGFADIYISNDFSTPDRFFVNQGDGTFKDLLKESFRHTAYFGMGSDMADFNNDGWIDLVQMDMTPADNFRSKANMASMDPEGFSQRVAYGFHYQYMQNAVQLNHGNIPGTDIPSFGDIGRLAGAATTDWSWATLLTDLDNNGHKDIFVTNGIRREVNNKDFFIALSTEDYFSQGDRAGRSMMEQLESMPSVKIPNYAFQNFGNLNFKENSNHWGLDMVGFSNGAAYGDLDNDGDQDLVVSNLDSVGLVFRNNSTNHNYLKIKLLGPDNNSIGLGANVAIETEDGSKQFLQQQPTRGYLSSVSPVLHFGLGENQAIKKLTVTWPDGSVQELTNLPGNQTLEVDYQSANGKSAERDNLSPTFTGIPFDGTHQEVIYDDYRYQVLLPHKLSQLGPAMATADINNDGFEDFFVGGASGFPGTLYLQRAGGFEISRQQAFEINRQSEDVGALFFDADGDQDYDLYVVSGSNEHEEESEYYRDRLYLNHGGGNFTYAPEALPDLRLSGQEISAHDIDQDGDLDLFVGGRQIARKWPEPVSSVILINESSPGEPRFVDATNDIAPDLSNLGLVTSSQWLDIDEDGDSDLLLAGEWMPLTVLINDQQSFYKDESYFQGTEGWWYRLKVDDIDQDGDMDIIAGNLGLNYKYQATTEEPFEVYAGFMDQNQLYDVVLGYYQQGVQYPVRGRQCSSQQMPGIKYKFPTYNEFAESPLQDIYEPEMLENSHHYSIKSFASGVFENQGNGNFEFVPFHHLAQISSINGIVVEDFDKDGIKDLLTAGNLYVSEVETTRNDASVGLMLKGSNQGFIPVPMHESGMYTAGDVKNLCQLSNENGDQFIVVANNNDRIQIFEF